MSRRKKPRPTRAPTWDDTIDALVGDQGREAARAIALRTGLLLVLRAQVPERASPAGLTVRDERAFVAALPCALAPAGRDTLRALRALTPDPTRPGRRPGKE